MFVTKNDADPIMKALGLDPKDIKSVSFEIAHNHMAVVTIERYMTPEELVAVADAIKMYRLEKV